jgi:hypothetical protein
MPRYSRAFWLPRVNSTHLGVTVGKPLLGDCRTWCIVIAGNEQGAVMAVQFRLIKATLLAGLIAIGLGIQIQRRMRKAPRC